jgi:hypothetical protein
VELSLKIRTIGPHTQMTLKLAARCIMSLIMGTCYICYQGVFKLSFGAMKEVRVDQKVGDGFNPHRRCISWVVYISSPWS